MWRKKFAPLVSLSLLLGLAGCTFHVPKDPSALVQNLPQDPENLNPLTSNSAYAGAVYVFVYEQLFELDNVTLLPKPKLAARWEISPDHLQYTFYLRGDVKWQDGVPFTADDVVYTYERIQDPKVDAAPLRNYMKDVLKAEKIDATTVRFTYRQPYFGALYSIGLMTIIPKHIFNNGEDFNAHTANRKPVGTGPFEFVEWKTGERVILKRFEKYWGPPYHFDQMLFKIVPDQNVTFQILKKRELDLIDLNPLQWARQTSSEKFAQHFAKHKLITPFGVYSYIGWNLKRPYFKDKRVRQALAHLVDRDELNDKLLFGLYQSVTGPYYPLGKNYDTSLPPMAYDLEKAKQLLEEAGWKVDPQTGLRAKEGVPFRFTLLFSSGVQFYEQLTPILMKNFLKAGIEVEPRRLEGVALFKLMQDHDFDAYMAAWGRGAGDEDLYQIWHSSQSQGGSNNIFYANPEVDRLLEEGRGEFDPSKRGELNKKIHRILWEDQPYLFMFARPDLLARDLRFKNVIEYPLGLDMREWIVE